MRNLNRVILIGHLGRDPEIKDIGDSQKMARVVVVTNRSWQDKNGNRQNQAEFHNCVAWGKTAEIVERYLNKSQLVFVEGYLKTRNWENEKGDRVYQTEIVIQDVFLLEKKGNVKKNINNNDSNEEEDNEKEKATKIEKNFQEKLSKENENPDNVADSKISDSSSNENNFLKDESIIDEPLFEEEKS